jgi:hypothetical protein
VGRVLRALARVLCAGAWRRRARAAAAPGAGVARARAAGLFGLTVLYIAGLPWLGYLLTSALYFGGASLLFGNRQPASIVIAMIVVPLALMLFFEKYMVVLLPTARLFE